MTVISVISPDDRYRGAAELVALASSRGVRIAVAESLTGGMLAAELVAIPGASAVFTGGVIAYDTSLKHTLLGVDAQLLANRGPVDADVAVQMAEGVRRTCAISGADSNDLRAAELGLATTGVAGPDPDSQTGLPAGTVWIAVSSERGSRAVLIPGLETSDRQSIRGLTVKAAIELALEELREFPSSS